MEKRLSRENFLKKTAKSSLSLLGIPLFLSLNFIKKSLAADTPCKKCNHAITIMGRLTGYITCVHIAYNKQIKMEDYSEYRSVTFPREERSCPARSKYNLPGFELRTKSAWPWVFSPLSPYGALGQKVTPGIRHPAGVYQCSRCGYGLFFINTSGSEAKYLLCGKCSNVMTL